METRLSTLRPGDASGPRRKPSKKIRGRGLPKVSVQQRVWHCKIQEGGQVPKVANPASESTALMLSAVKTERLPTRKSNVALLSEAMFRVKTVLLLSPAHSFVKVAAVPGVTFSFPRTKVVMTTEARLIATDSLTVKVPPISFSFTLIL